MTNAKSEEIAEPKPKLEEVKADVKPEIDLESLDTAVAGDKGARVAIVHPVTKDPIGIFITVLGKHSSTFRELVRERINKRVRTEALAARRGKPLDPRTAEEIEREALEMLVACTVGWETEIYNENGDVVEVKPTILLGSQHVTFNIPNALNLYTRILWMREQVDDAIGDLENFIPA